MENIFKRNSIFQNIYVKGEVSDIYISPIGHLYFTLNDRLSKVPCIVYKWFRKNIGFEIENGMNLLVTANVVVYSPHGKYQLDVRSATDDGLGRLFLSYKQLRKKLESEGLFDDRNKKELPKFPKRIGVITSKKGSVIHDIVKTVRQNWPYCQVILFPAAVQGPNSKVELVEQIRRADEFGMDVLIVARGGGSLEELWSYNEEEVVRTIFSCHTPVISAIGHEDDITLADLVSDKRASTPTMAASLAVNDRQSIMKEVNHFNARLITFISSKIDKYRKDYGFMLSKSIFCDSTFVYSSKKVSLESLCNRFDNASSGLLDSNRHLLENIKSEYVIRNPCKMQLDSSRSRLRELQTRLMDVMDLTLKSNQVNLDQTIIQFNFYSEKLIESKRHGLDKVKDSSVIRNPCRIQINKKSVRLKSSQDKLRISVNHKIESAQRDFRSVLNIKLLKNPELLYLTKQDELYKVCNKFKGRSNELVLKNSHRLNVAKNSPAIRNRLDNYLGNCSTKINNLNFRANQSFNLKIKENRKDLEFVLNKNIVKNPDSVIENKSNELAKLTDKFSSLSNGIILSHSYRLDAIKANPVIKNHLKNDLNYDSSKLNDLSLSLKKNFNLRINENKKNLEAVTNRNIIRSPYLILEPHKLQINRNMEKLEKLEQIINLKKEQKKQKATYTKIIAAIIVVVIMIIVLLILFGGI